MSTETRVAAIECWACSIPLPHPLSFGRYTIASREYAVVQLRCSGGLTAACVGLSRRAPVDVFISDVVSPHVLGKDALQVKAIEADLDAATRALAQGGALRAARSLVDICLWDLRSQVAGMPLWQMLGGNPRSLPILLVEGYALPEESSQQFAERIAARVHEGYKAVKVEGASYRNPADLAKRLELVRDLVGDQVEIIIDMAWSWQSAADGVRALAQWAPARPAWIEDPLPRNRPAEIQRLREVSGQIIGVGDETTDPSEIEELVYRRAIDIVRVDALTVGGIDGARQLTDLALRSGRGVSTHAHPEIHQHCAFGLNGHLYVEEFPNDRPFDLKHVLIEDSMIHPETGIASPPTTHGTGVRLVEDAVTRYAYRHNLAKL